MNNCKCILLYLDICIIQDHRVWQPALKLDHSLVHCQSIVHLQWSVTACLLDSFIFIINCFLLLAAKQHTNSSKLKCSMEKLLLQFYIQIITAILGHENDCQIKSSFGVMKCSEGIIKKRFVHNLHSFYTYPEARQCKTIAYYKA